MLIAPLHVCACKLWFVIPKELQELCFVIPKEQALLPYRRSGHFRSHWMKHSCSWCHICACVSREGKGQVLSNTGTWVFHLILGLAREHCSLLTGSWLLDLLAGCPLPSLCFLQSDPDLPPEPQTSSSADLGKFPGLPSHPVSQYVPPQPSIEEARQTMHSLLDDAFALVAPSSQAASSTAVTPPGVSAGQPVNNRPAWAWRGSTCTQWGSPSGPTQAVKNPLTMSVMSCVRLFWTGG